MAIEGADPGQLRQLARRFDTSSSELQHMAATLSAKINEAQGWRGPDADRFRNEWNGQFRSTILKATTALQEGSKALEKNAQEQERASDGSGTTVGAGGAREKATGPPIGDGDVGDGSLGTLDPKIAAEWANMSTDERRRVMEELIKEQAERYGIPQPNVDWTLSEGYGMWNENTKTMSVNPDQLNNPEATLDTIVHEMRHAGQYQWVREEDDLGWLGRGFAEADLTHPDFTGDASIDIHDVDKFAENKDDYYSGDDYAKYLNQPMEYDAWTTAGDYIDHLTPAEFERLRREAG